MKNSDDEKGQTVFTIEDWPFSFTSLRKDTALRQQVPLGQQGQCMWLENFLSPSPYLQCHDGTYLSSDHVRSLLLESFVEVALEELEGLC